MTSDGIIESIKSHLNTAGAFIGDSSAKASFILMVNSPPVGQTEAAETSQLYRERHCTLHVIQISAARAD